MTTQTFTNSYRLGNVTGVAHDFSADTIMLALYTSSATLDETTTAYSATNEAVGSGYVAGGAVVTVTATYPKIVDNRAVVLFDNVAWAASTITAGKALMYNASRSNAAITTFDFGIDKSSTANTFTVRLNDPINPMISM